MQLDTIKIEKDVRIKGTFIKENEIKKDLVDSILSSTENKNIDYLIIKTDNGDKLLDNSNKTIVPEGFFRIKKIKNYFIKFISLSDESKSFLLPISDFNIEYIIRFLYREEYFEKSFSNIDEWNENFDMQKINLERKTNAIKKTFENNMYGTFIDLDIDDIKIRKKIK